VVYVVEGMRAGLLGTSAVSPTVGLLALTIADLLVISACLWALRTGWKLRG
jgi:hypothetical protein